MATVNRSVIKIMLIRTELGNNSAYKIYDAGGNSGYSFGQPQWDLSANREIAEGLTAQGLFENILRTQIADETMINSIMDTVKDASLALTDDEERSVNAALSSEYGKQEINAKFDTYVDKMIGRLDSFVSELRAYSDQLRASGNTQEADRVQQRADYIDNNQLLQMEIIDYDNQFSIDGINTDGNFKTTDDGKFMQYLKNGETTINNGTTVTVEGDFDIKDYLNFIFNTTQGFKSLEDVLRRLSEIAKTAAENLIGGDMLTELQKLLLEAKDKVLDICDLLIRNREINNLFNRYFISSTQWRPSREPLTLDLDGDGIETVAINTNNPILFDHDADGVKTATGWIKSDDGLLVLDRNNNGVIDNGRELFGDSTVMNNGQTAADGFAALADLDSNADGQINANDTQFANLKVWRDINQDGVSQANELFTLEQQNIASISLTTTQNNQLL